MKKLVAFLTVITLLGGLTSCERNKTETAPDPLPSVSVSPTPTPTPAPSPTPPTVDVALTYDPEELKPWQTAYIQLLEGELERGARGFAEDAEGWRDPWYYLYDIDKDDVPELILMYNGSWDGIAYTYDQGEVNTLNKGDERDSLSINHGVLYTWPEGNGMLYVYSTAWACDFFLYYVDDGQLKWKEVDGPAFEVNEDGYIEEYPEIQAYYPDSQRLNDYSALVYAPERGINFLPILNYDPPKSDHLSTEQAEREEQRVKDAIDGDGWFYCVSEYSGGMGWITLEEYGQEEETTLRDVKWCDLNGDGVQDATLRFSNGDGLILSAQDGVVYGYALANSLDYYAWTSKGRFIATDPADRVWGGYRVHFAKNQFYTTHYECETIFPREFWHMIGAGGWSAEMNVEKDGTFEGNYNWHRIIENGEDWEMYYCDFSGKFSEPKQVNEYTYSVQLEKLDIGPGWYGMQNDEASLTKVEGEAPGLGGGEEFLIYLPGAPVEELPEEFLHWSLLMVDPDDTVLPSYGLYNVNTQIGWFDW